MRAQWPDLEQRVTQTIFEARLPVDVLIEYDGPQLLTRADSEGRKFLAVAADQQELEYVRWLEVSLSALEEEALLDGASTIRDVFLKDSVWIVDRDAEDHALDGWVVAGDQLGEDVLPRHGVRLSVERPFVGAPQLRIDGPRMKNGKAIRFVDLSNVGWSIQRLWTSIAQSEAGVQAGRGKFRQELAQRSTLFVAESFHGSFGLKLTPGDEATFDQVAAQFQKLVDSSDNAAQLLDTVNGLTARVAVSYMDLLKVLGDADLELYAAWSKGRSYLAGERARRIRPVLGEVTDVPETTIEVIGTFQSADVNRGRFEISEYDTNVRYAGVIGEQLLRTLRHGGAESITLGPASVYAATIRATAFTPRFGAVSSPVTRYALQGIVALEPVDEPDDYDDPYDDEPPEDDSPR
ncbi:hypothetical protein BH11MYX4_BH11MYX4_01940 [soil metagenome]